VFNRVDSVASTRTRGATSSATKGETGASIFRGTARQENPKKTLCPVRVVLVVIVDIAIYFQDLEVMHMLVGQAFFG